MGEILTKLEKDKLTEIANIGSGSATTALSKMLGDTVKADVPQFVVDRVEKLHALLGNSEDIVTVVLLKIEGDIPGIILLIMPTDSALKMAGILTNDHKKDVKDFNDLDRSAITEVGNIIAGNVLTSFSNFLGVNVLESVPDVVTDMFGSIVNEVFAEIGQDSEIAMVLYSQISSVSTEINGELYFIFDPDATKKMLGVLDKKFGK